MADTGEPVAEGELDFVGLATGGRVIEAYRFARRRQSRDYFDRQGRSVRKWPLQTPVDGARLSSGFGCGAIRSCGYTRMHRHRLRRADGTPVLAAGAGMVELAGRNRGYGNYVRLRHTATATPPRTPICRASGLSAGRRVRQGEVIGYVGATGLATGPHLHYDCWSTAGRSTR